MAERISQRPPHPLFGAELRAKRAKVHIRSLKRHIQRWTDAHHDYIETHEDGTWTVSPDLPIAEVLGRTGIWTGEAVFNLRAALDYLVYEIACTCNNERHVDNTQFPICDSPKDFERKATGRDPDTGKPTTCWLTHVPDPVIKRFRELQPFSGCEWTRTLRELSNPDKHRHLPPLISHADILPGNHPALRGLVEQNDETASRGFLVVEVFFEEPRLDIFDTLDLLQREVSALVEEFKPAFERIS